MEADSHPEIRDLKRIRYLSEFGDGQLTSLSQKLQVESARSAPLCWSPVFAGMTISSKKDIALFT